MNGSVSPRRPGVGAPGVAGKVAVVTGGAHGLGATIGRWMAAHGASVVLVDVDGEAAEQIAQELRSGGAQALAIACDVGVEDEVEAAAAQVSAQLGRCDILVNNATTTSWHALEDVPVDEWDRVIATNLRGYFLCLQRFGRLMLSRPGGGAVIHVASVCSRNPSAAAGAYSVTKAAQVMLVRQAAIEWGPRGVRCNAVSPGMVDGGMASSFQTDPGVRADRARSTALGRLAEPDEIAAVVGFLAGEGAAYVNGQEITVDGGFNHMLMKLLPRPGVPAAGRVAS